MDINCLIFDDFETLDLFGPVEVFGKFNECCVKYFSINGGIIKSNQNAQIITKNINKIEKNDIISAFVLNKEYDNEYSNGIWNYRYGIIMEIILLFCTDFV
jgi:GTPase